MQAGVALQKSVDELMAGGRLQEIFAQGPIGWRAA